MSPPVAMTGQNPKADKEDSETLKKDEPSAVVHCITIGAAGRLTYTLNDIKCVYKYVFETRNIHT